MVKKSIIFAIVLAVSSGVAYANEPYEDEQTASSISEAALVSTSYEVTATTLNIRTTASTSSKVLGKLNKKDKIAVLQITNNWAKIVYKNGYGYIHTNYIKKVSTNTTSSLTKYTVNTDDLNIRSTASSKGKILGKLNTGDVIEVYSISNSWAKIKNGSLTGYVYSKYIDKYIGTDNIPNTPVVPKPEETPVTPQPEETPVTPQPEETPVTPQPEETPVIPVTPPSTQQTHTKYTIITNSLNVRASKSTSGKKLGSLSDGTVVNVYNISNGWAEIEYNGKKAYVSSNYICKVIDSNKLNGINILVNKKNSLGKSYIPSDLITLNVKFKPGIAASAKKMRKESGKALEKMFLDAKKANINLVMYSGYRSYATQKSIYASNVSALGTSKADLVSAKAGLSEHQTGLSVDVVSSDYLRLDTGFAKTKAYKWIVDNAANYGFIIRYPKDKTNITGYSFEPWHLRYVGIDSAKEITSRNITLEEYLK